MNYDLPANGGDYVHRIGRAGLAGAVGHAISFAMPHQRADAIEHVIRSAVRISADTTFDGAKRTSKPKPEFRERSRSRKSNDNF